MRYDDPDAASFERHHNSLPSQHRVNCQDLIEVCLKGIDPFR